MTDNAPSISSRTRVSPLWIIPVAALVAGIWMVVQTYLSEGPTITIEFKTAEGLAAGKTRVKMLNVDVGLVEEVTLNEAMDGVQVTVSLEKAVTSLLREDTQFWVVRARVGPGGISGVGTLLSGGYIQLAPGTGEAGKRRFTGLELPPKTPVGAPGKRLRLVSTEASISAGDPLIYEGFKVGRIESMEFDPVAKRAIYEAFVDAPYDQLIHKNTRFWNVSGFGVDASAEGVSLRVGTVDTILLGGVAFGTPPGLTDGGPVQDESEFTLYKTYEDILKSPYEYGMYYVVSFNQSVAGLLPGAPVTYRGIQIGRVERILLKELNADGYEGAGAAIPVLIYVEPGRLELADSAESIAMMEDSISAGVPAGLRATLQTGNLLTGRKLIEFDFFPTAQEAEITQFQDWTELPTQSTGVANLSEQIRSLLAKLNSLPLENTVAGANRTLNNAAEAMDNLNDGITSLNKILASDSTQALSGELASTLSELRSVLDGFSQDAELYQDANASLTALNQALENINRLTRQLSERPNSLLFSPPPQEDPQPEARQ